NSVNRSHSPLEEFNKKIIIAENEPIIALDLQKILSQHGLKVTAQFSHVNQVFDYIKKDTPDLLISALYLEKSKIYFNELINLVNEKHFKIIFLSAAMPMKTKIKSSDNISFIKKPFKNEDLVSLVYNSLQLKTEK